MELEGLKRCLKELEDAGLKILTIVTDRHPSVRKWLRENRPEYKHRFDVWHVAKGK